MTASTEAGPHAVTFGAPITLQLPAPSVAVLVGSPHGAAGADDDPLRWARWGAKAVDALVAAGTLSRETGHAKHVATAAVVLLVTPGYAAAGKLAEAKAALEATGAPVKEVATLADLQGYLGRTTAWVEHLHYVGHATHLVRRGNQVVYRPGLLLSAGWPSGNLALFADALAPTVAAAAFKPDSTAVLVAAHAARPAKTDGGPDGTFARAWADLVKAKHVFAPIERVDPDRTYTEGLRLAQGPWKGEAIPPSLDGSPYLVRLARLDGASPGRWAAEATKDPTLIDSLKRKQGTRPRRYEGAFDGDGNTAERRFTDVLWTTTDFLNGVFASKGKKARVNACELVTNFLTEGAILALLEDRSDGLDGFSYFGVDTLVDRFATLRPWLHQELVTMIESGTGVQTYTNEKGEQVKTLNSLTIEQGLYANAAMYAWGKTLVEADLAAAGLDIADQPERVQVYWSTVYYNAGPGYGKRRLKEKGVDVHALRWTAEDDDAKWNRSAHFNACWRTVTYELLRGRVFHPTVVDETTLR